MTPHQRRLTAAREAVVEAAEEWHARPSLEQAVRDKTIKDAAEIYKVVFAKLDAAVANLRAVKKESEHG